MYDPHVLTENPGHGLIHEKQQVLRHVQQTRLEGHGPTAKVLQLRHLSVRTKTTVDRNVHVIIFLAKAKQWFLFKEIVNVAKDFSYQIYLHLRLISEPQSLSSHQLHAWYCLELLGPGQ